MWENVYLSIKIPRPHLQITSASEDAPPPDPRQNPGSAPEKPMGPLLSINLTMQCKQVNAFRPWPFWLLNGM